MPAKPRIIIAHVDGSGTAETPIVIVLVVFVAIPCQFTRIDPPERLSEAGQLLVDSIDQPANALVLVRSVISIPLNAAGLYSPKSMFCDSTTWFALNVANELPEIEWQRGPRACECCRHWRRNSRAKIRVKILDFEGVTNKHRRVCRRNGRRYC